MEIKKAWNNMKKDIEKELGIKGGFVMNKKQIEKRTATYTVCNTIPYDEEIDRYIRDDVKVQSYNSWTAEEKARHHNQTIECVNWLVKDEEKYGTKENKAKTEQKQIMNSKAFKKFEEAVGNAVCTIIEVDNDGCYKLRFYY